eukprot:8650130-Prorocentrum_lima.AAC.1
MKAFVTKRLGFQQEGPLDVYQDGLLGHMVGILRSQLQVPHQDNDGEAARACRRAMGRNITSIQARIIHE